MGQPHFAFYISNHKNFEKFMVATEMNVSKVAVLVYQGDHLY